jgi:hypothetical protein
VKFVKFVANFSGGIMQDRQTLIEKLRQFPAELEALVTGLSEEQLLTPALDGEWTIAQNVHHIPDSHMNSYIRCKLIATEDNPTLKPYDETQWSQFADASGPDLSTSLALLQALHTRWVIFWQSLPPDAWSRTGYHPGNNATVTLDDMLRDYVAHGEAHLDQIRRTLAAQ